MKFNLSITQLAKLDRRQIGALKILEDLNSDYTIVIGLDDNRKDNPLGVIILNPIHKNYEYLVNRKGIQGFDLVGTLPYIDFGEFWNLSTNFLNKHPDEYYEQEK